MDIEGDLDKFLSDEGATCRIETSSTFEEIKACIAPRTKTGTLGLSKYHRTGLGDWIAFGLVTPKLGNIYFAAPLGEKLAGCSIWAKPTATANISRQVVNYLSSILSPLNPKFIEAKTGEFITPSRPRLAPTNHPKVSSPELGIPSTEKITAFKMLGTGY